MPTYAYRCTVCSQELEAKQSFADEALTVCPECGGRLRKLFGAVGVVFKGSGFYRTDSRSGSKVSTGASSSNGSSSSGGGSSSGSGSSSSAGSAAAPAKATGA
ncbi:zinc ribbon domain-containing protein [Georgenia sp. 10Sc9-8]|uniref:Zinc ribbon domain-containing protein n=1 Tax=Georgenia halotolerans TaxID=3028317 RepID=A0ABT5TWJ4_9MICO|nr:zinc ribbon domain-containing protein [Georgenia halotolerans]